jgi:hypothetical protein
MNQPMHDATIPVEAIQEGLDQTRIAPLEQQEDGVSYDVRYLEQPCARSAGEIWDVSKIAQHAPSSSELAESSDPDPRSLVESALREDQEAALALILLMKPSLEKEIEPPAELRRSVLHRPIAVKGRRLFYRRREQDHARLVRFGDGIGQVDQYLRFGLTGDGTPESLASPDVSCMKGQRRSARKVLLLDLLQSPGQEERHPLEDGRATEHEMLVGGIVLIA